MPLAGRELPGPEWFANGRAAGGEETFGLLRGALEQVGALAALSAEVFDNLLRLSGETHERVASAAARADRLARRVGAADAAARRAAAFRCGAGRGRALVVGAVPRLLPPSILPPIRQTVHSCSQHHMTGPQRYGTVPLGTACRHLPGMLPT